MLIEDGKEVVLDVLILLLEQGANFLVNNIFLPLTDTVLEGSGNMVVENFAWEIAAALKTHFPGIASSLELVGQETGATVAEMGFCAVQFDQGLTHFNLMMVWSVARISVNCS
ncbi:hypothetical protein VU04_06220 [Desulfobulbus sp. TB]|nr:hypothetical protein [Desulfobulbus sp. TB]